MRRYSNGVLSYFSSNIGFDKRRGQRLIFDLLGVILVDLQGDVKTKNAYHHRIGILCSIMD